MPPLTNTARRTLLWFHAISGALLACFVLAHLANHALVLVDVNGALSLMETLRRVYRWPPAEMLLLACVVFQLVSGPVLARHSRDASEKTRWVTVASGYYLLFFLTIHISAIFWGRHLAALDTNIYFAAAGLQAWPYSAFFSVYYFLGVVAVFVHLGRAIMRRAGGTRAARKRTGLAVAAAAGVAVGAVIVAGVAGFGNGMQIPIEYMRVYQH